MGFEPTTPTLARLCSTPELRPHSIITAAPRVAEEIGLIAQSALKCNSNRQPLPGGTDVFIAAAEYLFFAGK